MNQKKLKKHKKIVKKSVIFIKKGDKTQKNHTRQKKTC